MSAVVGRATAAAAALLLIGCPSSEVCYLDADADGYGLADAFDAPSCAEVGAATVGGDCDDSRSWIHPDAWDAPDDGVDADCDGVDQVTCYSDLDGDGYGAGPFDARADDCDGVDGRTTTAGDCDDSTIERAPDNTEIPDDGVDQDCNGSDLISCFYDGDGDGYGFPTPTFVEAGYCGDDAGEVLNGDDCDDARADFHPGALEICDRLDQDCDGTFDAGDWHYVSAGTNAYFEVGALPISWGSFTIEMRLDVQSSSVEGGRPLIKKESLAGANEFRIDNGPAGTFWQVTIGDASAIDGPDVFHWPAPQHLAIVSEGPGLRFYVDGVLVDVWQGDAPASWTEDGVWTFLKDIGTDARSLLVDLKEVRVWSVVRTEAQILDGHCRPMGSMERQNLELYLPFENGGIDFSGNGRDPVYTNGDVHAPGGL